MSEDTKQTIVMCLLGAVMCVCLCTCEVIQSKERASVQRLCLKHHTPAACR